MTRIECAIENLALSINKLGRKDGEEYATRPNVVMGMLLYKCPADYIYHAPRRDNSNYLWYGNITVGCHGKSCKECWTQEIEVNKNNDGFYEEKLNGVDHDTD
jgi:hypothetical protein